MPLDPASALPSATTTVTVELATKRGIRTVQMRKDKLERSYGKLDYRGREVYAKKVKVETKHGYKKKAVNPKRLQREYTYVDKERRYKKYERNKLILINTTKGDLYVTEEQKKLTYKRTSRGYERKGSYRAKVKRYEKQVSGAGTVPGGYQMTIHWEATDANGKTYHYQTFSRVSNGKLTKEEARQQNAFMAFAFMKEDGIVPNYDPSTWDESITLIPTDEEYIHYVV